MDEPADLRISHIGYDRAHTTAEDRNTWLPQERLWEARDGGRIGALTARLYAVPTVRRARDTTDTHAPRSNSCCARTAPTWRCWYRFDRSATRP
ncbi:MAG: hypothetical protein R2755_03215 [Acidimicrobiales bacterium]